ncbi:hypothetical protein N9D31_01150 [Oligoflexaceae bacterium]|nr:hypothetical protein [Oligoflexaceae bacterium]
MITTIVKSSVLTAAVALSGCYIESHETQPAYADHIPPHPDYSPTDIPDSFNLIADICEVDADEANVTEGAQNRLCFENEEAKWQTSCRGYDCQSVPVYVHYMLSDDLGAGRNVTIEAFDNPYFSGSPISSVNLSNYTATKAGQFEKTDLYLGRGTYYARAYISNNSDLVKPYEYSNMTLVQDKPLGVYGALSSPATITVHRSSDTSHEPVNITIDKLFKKPGQAQDFRAYLRLNLSIDSKADVSTSRDLVIQLLSEPDIQMEADYQFKIPSESLKVSDSRGRTEFISESLEIGQYYVFAFIDENSNGYYDEGEWAQFNGTGGEMKPISIKEKRTKYLGLELSRDVDLELN